MKSPQKLLSELSKIRQVSLSDLHSFLVQDHTSFSVLSVAAKHIASTDRLTISLTKNSAKSFYLGPQRPQKSPGSAVFKAAYGNPVPTDDCLKDAQNCIYFALFNSTEKKLYTRFKDKVEANFEGSAASGPLLFLTLTFNTTQTNYSTWTTNWNPDDPCWNMLDQKQSWLKSWAQQFDPPAEPCKVQMEKVSPEVNQYPVANRYLQKFLRRVRLQWKPTNWKWVVVAELQKNGVWHFHLLSTPIVPYSHKCTLDKNFTSCWNCRTYLSQLWPYGRVQSKSPGRQTISAYLAKYLSKSFCLRELYKEHGLTDKRRSYRFYQNLYEYDQRAVQLVGKRRIDQLTNQSLPSHQTIFRHYDYATGQTSHFYRTNEQLIGKCAKPVLIKKNYRLGTRNLQPLNLLKLATTAKEKLKLKKPKQTFAADFQEHLITSLLLLCDKVNFVHLPTEQPQVPKEVEQKDFTESPDRVSLNSVCNQAVNAHFQTKPLLHFTFTPSNVPLALKFLSQLDQLAAQYALDESQDFYHWPFQHDTKHETIKQLGGLCGCEISARNNYLNNWTHFIADYLAQPP